MLLLPRPSTLPLLRAKAKGADPGGERRWRMERRGGCCIDMYAPPGASAEVAWKVGRIMHRYRPIAPRPAAGTAAPTEPCAPTRRPKRKRAVNSGSAGGGGGKRRMGKKKQVPTTAASISSSKAEDEKSSSSSSSSSSLSSSSSTAVTLPLMPETPERKGGEPLESPKLSPDQSPAPAASAPAWLWQGNVERPARAGLVEARRHVRGLGSWVTVECVTDTWREGQVQWRSDEAVRVALAGDDCPGFVSDAWDRIIWSNEAYRAMVLGSSISTVGGWLGEEEGEGEDVTGGLVTQGWLAAAWACRAFTCSVRVRYPRRLGRGSSPSLAAPCDVWKMDGGGFAWRLDVKTALSLSL